MAVPREGGRRISVFREQPGIWRRTGCRSRSEGGRAGEEPSAGRAGEAAVSYQDKTQDRDDGLGAVTSPVTVCGSSALSFRPLRRRVDLLFEFPPLGGFSFR